MPIIGSVEVTGRGTVTQIPRRCAPRNDKIFVPIQDLESNPSDFAMDHEILKSVAEQMMTSGEVSIGGKTLRVMRTGSRRFRTVRFVMDGVEYQAIEQNPEKPSRWGQLARDGHRVVQVRDLGSGKYVAAVVDGKVTEYVRR